MALQNPYQSALATDPAKEQETLMKLKSDPKKMAELGLAPNEDFSKLKSDPVKYNRVLSYVKGESYKSPAYAALAEGKTAPEFVQSSTQTDYGATPSEYRATIAPKLQEQFNVEPLQKRAQTYDELSYSAPDTIKADVIKKGGYDIPALKKANDDAVTHYLDIQDKYIKGQVDRATYIAALSGLSTASRSLHSGEQGLVEETNKGINTFKLMAEQAKNTYENAYKKFNDALDSESKGYGEARSERRAAAEDMFNAAKDMLDKSIADEKAYQAAHGKIYNPNTGKYEAKPGSGSGASSKMFTEADKIRKEIQDGKLDWGQAYGRMAAQFPEFNKPVPGGGGKTYIDDALGGQAKFTATGEYDAEGSTGFAKAGKPQGKKYTEANVPTDLYQEMITNVNSGATLIDLLNTYPDVDPDLVKKLFNANQ